MLEVNGVKIGMTNKPYIIAEMSAIQGGDIEQGPVIQLKKQKKLVRAR